MNQIRAVAVPAVAKRKSIRHLGHPSSKRYNAERVRIPEDTKLRSLVAYTLAAFTSAGLLAQFEGVRKT